MSQSLLGLRPGYAVRGQSLLKLKTADSVTRLRAKYAIYDKPDFESFIQRGLNPSDIFSIFRSYGAVRVFQCWSRCHGP